MNSPSPVKPRWNLRILFCASLFIAGITIGISTAVGDRPLRLELEIATSVIGILMLVAYWWILFHGVEFHSKEEFTFHFLKMPDASSIDIPDVSGLADVSEGLGALAELGPLGLVVAIPLAVIVIVFSAILLACGAYVLIFLGINVAILSIFMFVTPLFFIFKNSIVYVLRHQKECHGSYIRSLKWSMVYAVSKTIMLYAIIYLAHVFRLFLEMPA